jgi:hypothetical protein
MKIHMMLWVLWLIQATPILVASQSSHGSPNTKHIKKHCGTSVCVRQRIEKKKEMARQ